jgi:saccharopine dehydrogenase-like NADP-dependent oxidoreductase
VSRPANLAAVVEALVSPRVTLADRSQPAAQHLAAELGSGARALELDARDEGPVAPAIGTVRVLDGRLRAA